MSTDLDTARQEVADAEAAVESARARLRDVVRDQESRGVSADGPDDGKPVRQTAEDALAWIRRKHGQTRSEQVAANGMTPDRHEEGEAQEPGTTAASGREEARRRAAARGAR